jgi:hypothetical protein
MRWRCHFPGISGHFGRLLHRILQRARRRSGTTLVVFVGDLKVMLQGDPPTVAYPPTHDMFRVDFW